MSAHKTPWQRTFERFGLNQSEFARLISKDRSKICKALRDRDGLIGIRDQVKILNAAKKTGVEILPTDWFPFHLANAGQTEASQQ